MPARGAISVVGAGNLFAQNIRVAQAEGDELAKIVHFEAVGRLPFGSEEAEVRYIEADDVRQGDTIRREVILLACHRPTIDRLIGVVESAGLNPVAIDVEPLALLRCYGRQFRRDVDQQRRVMFVEIGASNTVAVVARGTDTMFVKYIDIGGKHFDNEVARHLKMTLGESASLRRHNADRPKEQRDAEIDRGVGEAVRSTLEKLAHELSLCIRYYSVTFRGQPLDRIVLGGGEASEDLAEWLAARLDLPCDVGDPLRPFEGNNVAGRAGQWKVAAGLAMRETSGHAQHRLFTRRISPETFSPTIATVADCGRGGRSRIGGGGGRRTTPALATRQR